MMVIDGNDTLHDLTTTSNLYAPGCCEIQAITEVTKRYMGATTSWKYKLFDILQKIFKSRMHFIRLADTAQSVW